MTALSSLMGISQTEVYEVATFYHHFDVVESDKDKPPALTVGCDSVSCEMNGANELAKMLMIIIKVQSGYKSALYR